MILRYAYSFLMALLSPLIVVRLLWRSVSAPAYRKRLAERFAQVNFGQEAQRGIWVHAASVGETVAVVPLIKRLQSQYPGMPIVFTTTTPTGSAAVERALGESVFHCYVPLDLAVCMRAFLRQIQPKLVMLVETELWPNMLHYCGKANIPVFLANARLSEHSARGYGRLGSMARAMLKNIAFLAAQSQADADRFMTLGMNEAHVQIAGNLKYDIELPGDLAQKGQAFREKSLSVQRPVWIAASTHGGEEEIVLAAFKRVKQALPGVLLVLVPRHPERFDKVAELCVNQGFSVVRRSTGASCYAEADIFLGDSMGELMLFYAASDIALVSGSLVPNIGGHNPIEPAALKLPILMGPHVFNCSHIIEQLWSGGGALQVKSAEDLSAAVIDLLSEPVKANHMGETAYALISAHKGALDRHLALLEQYLKYFV